MPDQLMEFKARAPLKALMTVFVLLTLVTAWFVVRWYLANTIAEYFHPENNRIATAQLAVGLGPSDPLPHWRLGNLIQKEMPPDQIGLVVSEYEKAVSLSPNDYRLWMDYGGALEQAGDFERAEKALRRAVKLAPSYAQPRWYLGNLFLRTDRYGDGFLELQKASQADERFQSQLFNLAWQLNKDDFNALQLAVGSTPEMRASFATYLVKRGRFDDGLRLWNSLTLAEKREALVAAGPLIGDLISAHRYHDAMTVWNEVAPGPAYLAADGRIIDRGFEDNLAHGAGAVFGWQVQSNSQVQIGIDAAQGHSGSRSLRLYFQVRSHIDTINVSQLVPVKPGTEYDFECYLKTERLESAETPVVVIANAADDAVLAASSAAPSGNSDWQRVTLSFKAGDKTEAIKVKMLRNSCPNSPVCPVFGTVWYDDFDLRSRK
jgi:Flp pilus assembly protein TadD